MATQKVSPIPDEPDGRTRGASRRRWLHVIAWAAASMALILLAVSIAMISVVNSDWGHSYARGLAEKKASEALGVPVQLQNFAVHLPTMSLDLYGIRVSGATPYPNPPLLQADHLGLGIRIVSVFGRKWYLD